MRIITKTTFVVGKGKDVGPGEPIDIDKDEALSLIERGLAELPQSKVVDKAGSQSADDEVAGAGGSVQ